MDVIAATSLKVATRPLKCYKILDDDDLIIEKKT